MKMVHVKAQPLRFSSVNREKTLQTTTDHLVHVHLALMRKTMLFFRWSFIYIFLYHLECILAKLTESPGSPFSPLSPSKPSHPCNDKKGTRLFQWWPADASQNQTGLQCSERVDAQRRAALTLSPRSPAVPGSPFWHLDRPLRPFSPCLAKNSGGEKKRKTPLAVLRVYLKPLRSSRYVISDEDRMRHISLVLRLQSAANYGWKELID